MLRLTKVARLILVSLLVSTLMVGASAAVMADWEPNDPGTKWVQMPDVSGDGIAILSATDLAIFLATVADDFECTETGLITDIHVWGSWQDDLMPSEPPSFYVVIWSDIPEEESPTDYSMPGDPLAEYVFGPEDYEYEASFYNDEYERLFMGGGEEPASVISQYNFYIPEEDAFLQEQGTVYWLSVALFIPDIDYPYHWGWNIAQYEDRWNDDAVILLWAPGIDDTDELRYPDLHQYQGESMDMAFVITGPPTEPSPPSTPTQPSEPANTVGGDIFSVNKIGLIAPWVALGLIIVAGGLFLYRRRVHSVK